MLAFNLLGFLAVYALQRFQVWLPLEPGGLAGDAADSSFNTAVSFATNTNWQGYGGETTMSYLTQMLGLNVQNFLSAASGMAVLVALMRGFTRKEAKRRGQLLGRHDPLDPVRPAAPVADPVPGPGEPGRGADLLRLRQGRAGASPMSTSRRRRVRTAKP
jgi:hypothetical protein